MRDLEKKKLYLFYETNLVSEAFVVYGIKVMVKFNGVTY